MAKCPECKFDGTQKLPNEQTYPSGYTKEPRLKLKTVFDKKTKKSVDVPDLDSKGRSQWEYRMRCPACGHTEPFTEEKASSKPKNHNEGDQ